MLGERNFPVIIASKFCNLDGPIRASKRRKLKRRTVSMHKFMMPSKKPMATIWPENCRRHAIFKFGMMHRIPSSKQIREMAVAET
jgi:hypothetical protein